MPSMDFVRVDPVSTIGAQTIRKMNTTMWTWREIERERESIGSIDLIQSSDFMMISWAGRVTV